MPLISPFSQRVLDIGAEWRKNRVVISDPNFINDVPNNHPLSRNLPGNVVIDGEGNFVINPGRPKTWCAIDKIVSDLAGIIGFPVPPARLLGVSYDADEVSHWEFTTILAFYPVRNLPPAKILKADPHFINCHIFDQWVMMPDRYWNIIYNPKVKTAPVKVAYIDHEACCSHENHYEIGWRDPLPYFNKDGAISAVNFSKNKKSWIKLINDEIRNSETAQEFFGAIEGLPDAVIRGVVEPLPDVLFQEEPEQESRQLTKSYVIDLLRYRRDHIRSLTLRGLDVG